MKASRPSIARISDGVYRLDLRGKTFERILQTISDGKKTLQFQTRKEAEEKADEIERLLTEYGKKRLENLDHVFKADPATLAEKLLPFNKTIADAVDFYVSYLTDQAAKEKSQTLGTLMDEWLAEQWKRVEQGTRRFDTYDTVYYKVNGADGYKAQWGNRPVATITSKEIQDWIESRKIPHRNNFYTLASQTTKSHQRACLSQFFNWCMQKYGVPKDNPCDTIKIERAESDPEFFTPEETQTIMDLSMSKRFLSLLPFHAICLFAGVRTDECARLDWNDIDFDDKAIAIHKAYAKTRKHRRVEMQPNLLAWLKWFKEKYPQYPLIPGTGFDDRKRQFRKKLGIRWAKNGMRHSYASYILGAKRGDFGYLEQHMGNSRTMLQNHYVSFPPKETSEKYWSIQPPA